MPIVELKKPNINLWEEYPDLDIIEEFKKIRLAEGDEKSNNILKAIYYIWDPKSDKRDSGFTEQELIKDINKNLIGEKAFNWKTKDREALKQAWFKYCMTKTDMLLRDYQEQVEGMNAMHREWPWSPENAKEKAASMSAYKTVFADYKDILKDFNNEKLEREEMEGGYQPSMNELEADVEGA